jgi:hypothetical protein
VLVYDNVYPVELYLHLHLLDVNVIHVVDIEHLDDNLDHTIVDDNHRVHVNVDDPAILDNFHDSSPVQLDHHRSININDYAVFDHFDVGCIDIEHVVIHIVDVEYVVHFNVLHLQYLIHVDNIDLVHHLDDVDDIDHLPDDDIDVDHDDKLSNDHHHGPVHDNNDLERECGLGEHSLFAEWHVPRLYGGRPRHLLDPVPRRPDAGGWRVGPPGRGAESCPIPMTRAASRRPPPNLPSERYGGFLRPLRAGSS